MNAEGADHEPSAPAEYEAWYHSARGRWIGEVEYRLAMRRFELQPGASVLDVGCGTGWFSRRANEDGFRVTGLDRSRPALDFARACSGSGLEWIEGDARNLPFGDATFDHVLSIAALCFVEDAARAVAETVRVARRSFSIGWLNRTSLLYWSKGRAGGSGAYRGARWQSAAEVRALCGGLPVRNVTVRSAVFLPSGSRWARWVERQTPAHLPWGGLLVISGDKA